VNRDGTPWQRVPTATHPDMPPDAETFINATRGLAAIRSRELGRWHLSVSHRDRIPTWGELGYARDTLLPADVWLMIAHPPRAYWLNYDSRVLHLWEFDDHVLIEQFKFEGEHAQAEGFGTPDDGQGPSRRPISRTR
jgi:hypothetical protein